MFSAPVRSTCPANLSFAECVQIFSNSFLFHSPSDQIFSSVPCSRTPSIYIPPLLRKTKFPTHTELQVNYSFVYFHHNCTAASVRLILCDLHFIANGTVPIRTCTLLHFFITPVWFVFSVLASSATQTLSMAEGFIVGNIAIS